MSRVKETGPADYYLPWGGWFEIPAEGGYSRAQLAAMSGVDPQTMPVIPDAIKFQIPNGISLTVFRNEIVECNRREAMVEKITGRELTYEQAHRIMHALEAALTTPAMLAACTVRGEGRKIKSNKPEDSLMAYMWRMARFQNGTDPSMPMTCYWDLEDGINKLVGINVSTCIVTDNIKLILRMLDTKVTALVLATGGDPNAAAKRWGRALGYTL